MRFRLALIAATTLLGACAHGIIPSEDRERTLRIGQTGDFGQIRVTPVQVVQDSRCPAEVQCVQAGSVRVRALVEPPFAGAERILELEKPQQLAGGTLALVQAEPAKSSSVALEQSEYRLVLRYTHPRRD